MGMVTKGIPQQIAIDLARTNSCTIFVETGTSRGNTTRWAANHFKTVHTIERAKSLYELYREKLAKIDGVTPHLGDSRDILPKIVDGIHGERAVFWLDGHWSGGETAGEDDECPLLDELACLSSRTGDIILIDDARLFLSAPPPPHKSSYWPTIVDIVNALPVSGKKQYVQIVDDVIFIVPNEDGPRHCLLAYAQRRSHEFWEQFVRNGRGKSFLTRRLSRFFRA